VILLVAAALCLILGVAVMIGYVTMALLHPARPAGRPSPANCGTVYEDIQFAAEDGIILRGWFFPQRDGLGRQPIQPEQSEESLTETLRVTQHDGSHYPVIIYCPGRGEGLNAFDFRYASLFHNAGYETLMFDWRGMGASAGQTSMGFWERLDLKAAVEYARRRCSGKIGVFGTSLGAAVIYLAAGEIPEIEAAAGECGFATFEGMIADGLHGPHGVPVLAARGLGWAVARLAARQRHFPLFAADPVRAIGRISPRPVFVIHGKRDNHVPVAAAQALYAAAGEPRFLWLHDHGHTEGLSAVAGEYGLRVLGFFDHWLKDQPGVS
jgi:uncharacterized protein